MQDTHKNSDIVNDDRAQYKKTLNNFLARDGKNKKAADYSDETDSAEDAVYTKKLTGGAGDPKKGEQKKLKIFDDDDCEGEGSDDDSGDDESYEDQADDDDDSDEEDDLMSSGDEDNNSGGAKKQEDNQAKDNLEKASF